ncbi:MAG: hypothetical protein Q8K82_16805 [Gemmatimonadaceae bacterium]|nr:hypothetical protein [Gemmatimonadaceae bacterium]
MSRWLSALAVTSLLVHGACRSAPREEPDETQVVPPAAATPAPAATTPAPATRGGAVTGAPVVAALVPDSVRLSPNTISEIVVRGTGFASTGTNTVHIGPIVLRSVPGNAEGTEIRVVVPTRYTANTEAPPRPLFPASYAVTVETGGHTSNSVMLKVIP